MASMSLKTIDADVGKANIVASVFLCLEFTPEMLALCDSMCKCQSGELADA